MQIYNLIYVRMTQTLLWDVILMETGDVDGDGLDDVVLVRDLARSILRSDATPNPISYQLDVYFQRADAPETLLDEPHSFALSAGEGFETQFNADCDVVAAKAFSA